MNPTIAYVCWRPGGANSGTSFHLCDGEPDRTKLYLAQTIPDPDVRFGVSREVINKVHQLSDLGPAESDRSVIEELAAASGMTVYVFKFEKGDEWANLLFKVDPPQAA